MTDTFVSQLSLSIPQKIPASFIWPHLPTHLTQRERTNERRCHQSRYLLLRKEGKRESPNWLFVRHSCYADFPVPYITHVDMVEAGLESLDSDVLVASSTIESARFMNNRIANIDEDAFR